VAAGSVEAQLMPGGQLMITTEVENYPGFPEGIEGPELMERFMAQAKRFGAQIIEEWATDFKFQNGGPQRVKIGNDLYEAETIILANGAAARWLNAPNEEKYRNRGISACATCDGPLPVFRNQHIFVLGGGDSACEEALFLTRFASKVTLIHRRDQLRASKIMAKRVLEHPKIEVAWNTVIEEYAGEQKLEGIKLKNIVSGEIKTVPAGGLFMAIGHEPLTRGLEASGIELDAEGYIRVHHDMVFTNIDGVFTCGDVHDTVFRQAVTAAGFGCMAAIATERWLESKNA
jgi:thioredoxin reductase (NADPH)